ncbi:MAG: DUF4124 domain-containing protein [Nevskiaceae bacterium]|nr:MAG: DUF4124 domain-containing protein [Nevskiaceae bacterium]
MPKSQPLATAAARPLDRTRRPTQRATWAVMLLGLYLLPAAVSAQASVYRWVDARGQVHYSQTPPAKGAYRLLDTPAPTVFTPDRKAMSEFLQAADQREAAGQQARALADQQRVADAGQCAEASTRLEYLESRPPRRFFVTGPDGEPSRMTDEQWEARKGEAQARILKSCR